MPEYLEIQGFTNLKGRVSLRGGSPDYHYRDRELGEAVNVTVGYTKGGTSYMNGKKIPRGIYVRLSETTIEKTEFGETESFYIGLNSNHGYRWGSQSQSYMVRLLERGNPKLLKKIAGEVDPIAPSLADHFRKGDQISISAVLAQVALKAVA